MCACMCIYTHERFTALLFAIRCVGAKTSNLAACDRRCVIPGLSRNVEEWEATWDGKKRVSCCRCVNGIRDDDENEESFAHEVPACCSSSKE